MGIINKNKCTENKKHENPHAQDDVAPNWRYAEINRISNSVLQSNVSTNLQFWNSAM
jgi:hypothetical protein